MLAHHSSLNIYVLPDGILQPQFEVAQPIRRLVAKLKENGKYQVGIQLISFDSDSNSEALIRLKDLHDNLGFRYVSANCSAVRIFSEEHFVDFSVYSDIIDHKMCGGFCLGPLILGLTDQGNPSCKCRTRSP
jgi:hypothetical protein